MLQITCLYATINSEIQRQSLGQGEIPYRRYSPRACMVIVIKPDDKELSLQPGHDLV